MKVMTDFFTRNGTNRENWYLLLPPTETFLIRNFSDFFLKLETENEP